MWRAAGALLVTAVAAAAATAAAEQRPFNITRLAVPDEAHEEAELECRYDADFTVLKWWKGRQEFFRYRPGGAPSTRSFPALGVGGVSVAECGPGACRLRLTGLAREASGVYRCDLERERPPYRFATRAAHMLVRGGGAGGRPALSGVRAEYGPDEPVAATCEAGAGAGSSLRWYVNGQEVERARDRTELHLPASRLLFLGAPPELVLQCARFQDGRLLGSSSARARWAAPAPTAPAPAPAPAPAAPADARRLDACLALLLVPLLLAQLLVT